jgi:hypothetical protein
MFRKLDLKPGNPLWRTFAAAPHFAAAPSDFTVSLVALSCAARLQGRIDPQGDEPALRIIDQSVTTDGRGRPILFELALVNESWIVIEGEN